jgi:hypothetical protein
MSHESKLESELAKLLKNNAKKGRRKVSILISTTNEI